MNLLDITLVFLLHNWLNPERFEQKRQEKKRGADLFFFINMASTFHPLERPQFFSSAAQENKKILLVTKIVQLIFVQKVTIRSPRKNNNNKNNETLKM